MSFVKIDGLQLVRAGKPLHLRGLNTGNWLLVESYMIGLPWTEYKMRALFRRILGEDAFHAFWDTFLDESLSSADLDFIQSCGFNFLQVPINYRHFDGDGTTSGFTDHGTRSLDRLVVECKKRGIYVLLSLHAAPGVQARDWNAESAYGESYLWEHEYFQARTCEVLQRIAGRYRNEEMVIGTEILNEPLVWDDDEGFHQFNMKAIRAVRQAAPDQIIVVNGNMWGKTIKGLRPEVFEDPQVMPSAHCYISQFPPFGEMTDYPGEWNGKQVGRAEATAVLDTAYDQTRIPRPVLMGEFGIYARSKNITAQFAMLDDLTGFFEEKGFHWTFWDYKDIGDMGLVFPNADTPWMKFLRRPDVDALHHGYERHTPDLVSALQKECPELSIRDLDIFANHQARHHWDAIALPAVLEKLKACSLRDLEAMARSFAFENCQVHPEKYAILTKYAKGTDV
jgi:endoglucanase